MYLDPGRFDEAGPRIAGDASSGPLRPPGGRVGATDSYDWLGVSGVFSRRRRTGAATARRRGLLGLHPLVAGHRLGLPMLSGDDLGSARRARAMAAHGTGDSAGRPRFVVSSRSWSAGPTIGDGTVLSGVDGDSWSASGLPRRPPAPTRRHRAGPRWTSRARDAVGCTRRYARWLAAA